MLDKVLSVAQEAIVIGLLIALACVVTFKGAAAAVRFVMDAFKEESSFEELLRSQRLDADRRFDSAMATMRQEWRAYFEAARRQRARRPKSRSRSATAGIAAEDWLEATEIHETGCTDENWSGNGHDTYLDTGMHGFGTHFDHD